MIMKQFSNLNFLFYLFPGKLPKHLSTTSEYFKNQVEEEILH